MARTIGYRITIQDFVNTLETISFNEITSQTLTDKLKRVVAVSDVENYIKDVHIDDYVFTVYKASSVSGYKVYEGYALGFKVSDVILSNNVIVFLPFGNNGEDDIEGIGEIVQVGKHLELQVKFNVE